MRCLDNSEALSELVELRKRNLQLGNRDADATESEASISVAGSMKKNTAFTKKLRTGAIYSQLDSLVSELSTLRLDKYLSEIVSAMAESRIHSNKDLYACVKIGYLLYERYVEFRDCMTSALLKILNSAPVPTTGTPQQKKDREESRLLRQRIALRLLVEFYLAGIIVDPPKDYIIPNVLHVLCMDEKSCLVNSSTIVAFAKSYGNLFFDVDNGTQVPLKEDTTPHESSNTYRAFSNEDLEPYIDALLPAPVRNSVRRILQTYYKWITTLLYKEQKQMKQAGSSNYEYYIAMGEVTCERQAQCQKLSSSYERVISVAKPLAKYLGFEEPDGLLCQVLAPGVFMMQNENNENSDEKNSLVLVWDDDELKSFYEGLIDLKPLTSEIDADQGQKRQPPDPSTILHADSKSSPTPQRSQVDQLLPKLHEMVTTDDVDSMAINFIAQNTKSARKKLVKALLSVPKHRSDLLPLYSRLVATLNQVIPTIGPEIVEALEEEFLRCVKTKVDEPIADRVKNVRYLGELVKFKIVPEHVALHCINRLLDDFRLLNVDLLCIFLETCGRFLYKFPSTSPRMTVILDILKRKKTAPNINHRQAIMIENAYYSCCPPDQPAIKRKQEEPVILYMRNLMLLNLSKSTVEKTLRQLRKLDWEDPHVVSHLKTCFLNTKEFKFTDMDLIAYLIHGLMRHYPEFSIDVIDGILEQIKFGLELNIYNSNQQRISAVKLVGELYNYKLIQSSIIFDTLYKIIGYGHEMGIPRYLTPSPLDSTHDFFRVRLCCTFLWTCGQYFTTGKAARRLECFMCFMQMYLLSKEKCPVDISILVSETIESYCQKVVTFSSYISAAEHLVGILIKDTDGICPQLEGAIPIIKKEIQHVASINNNDISRTASAESGLVACNEYASESTFFNTRIGSQINETASYHSACSTKRYSESSSDADTTPEELREFDEEYNKLVNNDEQTPPRNIKPTSFVLPKAPVGKTHCHKAERDVSGKDDEVPFVVLTKKNNKHLMHPLSLPKDAPFAASTRERFIAEQEEKKQLKKLVLDYERREMSGNENDFTGARSKDESNKGAKAAQKCAIPELSENHLAAGSSSGTIRKHPPHQSQLDTQKKSPKGSKGR